MSSRLTFISWAIRNCGIILLKSLIDCLFGSSEIKDAIETGWDGKSIKLAYEKYPTLPDLLLRLINSDMSTTKVGDRLQISSVESVFPALDIIRRAGPPEIVRDIMYQQACARLGSKVWHVREIAARTVCTLLLREDWLDLVCRLLEHKAASINYHHGVLMAINFFLERQMTLDINVLLSKSMLLHYANHVDKV